MSCPAVLRLSMGYAAPEASAPAGSWDRAPALLFPPKGHDEDVAVPGLRRIERRHRRHPVKNAVVVGHRRIQWIGQRKAAQRTLRQIADAGLAARNVDPADEQYEHPVDAVAMHPFRGWPAFVARTRL